jgi:AraC-like DNA-binding protein
VPVPTLEPPDHATYLARPAGSTAVVLVGPQTRARYHPDGPGPGCVKMRLRPGHAGVFGVSPRDLADRDVPVTELRPDRPDPRRTRLVERAATMLSAGTAVHEVAAGLHLSERHLRTLFTDATGLPPSRFVRIARVRFVLDHLDLPLRDLAAVAGYYDQSHLTTDFRRVMGVPPAAFLAGAHPATTPCRRPPR